MADTNDVVSRITLEGADKAARDMRALADSSQAAARGMSEAERAAKSGGGSLSGMVAGMHAQLDAAQVRMRAADNPYNRAVEAEVRAVQRRQAQVLQQRAAGMPVGAEIAPAGIYGRGGGGGALSPFADDGADDRGGAGANLGRRYNRQIYQIIGLNAAAQAIRGYGAGLEEVASKATTANEALAIMFRNIVEHVPILGPAARGLQSMADAGSGLSSMQAANLAFLQASGQQVGLAGFAAAQRAGGREGVFGLRRDRRERGLTAAGAAEFAAALTPATVAGYYPSESEMRRLEADAGTGAARRAADEAQQRVNDARRIAEGRRGDVDAEKAEIARLEQRDATLRREAVRFSQQGRRLIEGAEATPLLERVVGTLAPGMGVGSIQAKMRAGGEEAFALAANRAEQVAQNQVALAQQREVVEKRITDAKKANEQLAQREFEAERGTLQEQKNRLGLLDRQVQRGESAAVFAATAHPGQLEAIAEGLRVLRGGGSIQSLPPAVRALIQSHPAARGFFEEAAIGEGARNPVEQQIEALAGVQPLGDVRAERDQARLDFERRSRQAAADLTQKLDSALSDVIDDLIDALIQAIENRISAKANEIRNQNDVQRAQGKKGP